MCMIVDANIAHRALIEENDPDFGEIHDSLFSNVMPHAKIVYGGHLTTEYNQSNKLRRIVAQLDRAGRARQMENLPVDQEADRVERTGLCQSDDFHIIALARVSRVRLLCSHDQALHADFTNRLLLAWPRGKVYQNRTHKALLRTFCGRTRRS